MGKKVLILGRSGTGKTASMELLPVETTAIVSPEKDDLPFRTQFKMLTAETDSKKIIKFMDDMVKEGKKVIVIDDFQYVLAIPYMNRIHEGGWDKYNDFGGNYFEILDHVKELPDDVIVYFMSHNETLEDGTTTIKLIGKLLREKITIEGLFTIVLETLVNDGKYYFTTQNSGKNTVKSPKGMFDTFAIDNDLAYVDAKIRNYYYMDGAKTDEEMKVADEQAAAPEVEKPTPRGRRRTTAPAEETPVEEPKARTRRSRAVAEAVEEAEKTKEDEFESVAKVIEEVAGDREEVPFDEVAEAISQAEEKPTRRRRVRGN